MGHLSQDEFFTALTSLFNDRKASAHGSIFLTQKRLSYDQPKEEPSESNPFPDLNPSDPLPVIIRATNGKSKEKRNRKVKLSTIVKPEELEGFYARYAECCKAGMAALKPRDRTKRKAKEKARRKKGGAVSAQ
ncbi:signal recognition particle 14kD protein-domain-containing protein [Podospora australis]|uniref:Signal recognition particle subunit SRP14 n=1 Tax=Podospora australis TaxID=1536484 RepID=A0AAN7ADD3_9PEZI|nr:signal recognition particle 14kD protein-domain-containing protein [Podospora australis]